MKKIFIICFSLFCAFLFSIATIHKAQAQSDLTVVQGAGLGITPLQLVQQVLVGSGITVSNATFNGSGASISSNMLGHFTSGTQSAAQLGFTGGIIIACGNAAGAIGPNSSGSNGASMGTGSDPDIELLISASLTVYDKAVLEFDFVPISDTVRFRYVFGSEEFDEFCGSIFQDAFGFFISGPGISGPFSNNSKNIALMPPPYNNYVTIDNICNSRNDPNVNPLDYSWYNLGGQQLQYDRLTTVYTAWCVVQPCVQYHIKLAVGDAGDGAYDSGVFLEENSFTSNGLSFNTSYSSNIDTVAVEGCNDAIITFHLGQPTTVPLVIHYTVDGTAIEGIDYPDVPDSLIIPIGQDSAYFLITPIADGLAEPSETVQIIYINTTCGGQDTINIIIKDYTPLSTSITPEVNSCDGQAANISVVVSGGFTPPPITYEWSESAGNTADVNVNPPTPTMYYITVSDACNYFTVDSVMVSISNLSNLITSVDSVTCFGYNDGSATVTASNGLEPYHYLWSPSNDTTATAASLVAGTYFVTVTDDIGCTSTNFVILDPPPQIGLILTPTDETCITKCNGSISSILTGNYSQPVSYVWNTSPAQNTPNASNLCPGDYTLTVTYSSHNCFVIETANIITTTLISADFITDPAPPDGYVPLNIQFTYSGFGAYTYDWNFGDTHTSTVPNPSNIYEDMGVYDAVLIVNSGPPNYCADTNTVVVHALIPSKMEVPNVFTPNDDTHNDMFQIKSQGVQNINVDIFNRWGKKIFNFNSAHFSEEEITIDIWDGTTKSEGKCADGVYFYILDAVGFDKKEYNLQGTLTLMR